MISWNSKDRRHFGNTLLMLLLALSIGLGGGYGWYQYRQRLIESRQRKVITARVATGPFDHIIIEQGDLESSRNEYVVCEVKSPGKQGTRILWVIEDGSYVREGDILVQLDSSALEDELTRQRIVVANAEAALIRSSTNAETARISLPQYMEGTYLSERKLIASQVARAEQNLRAAQLSLAGVQRLADKGSITKLQLESEENAVANAQNLLEEATSRLRVLDHLTKEKFKVQLEGDITAAEAQLRSDQSALREHVARLDEIEDQISKCTIVAPADGVVIHNNVSGKRFTEFVVEEGAHVRERQVILKLPDLNHMRVKTQINEMNVMAVGEGMPAKIIVDAVPAEMIGRVEAVKKHTKRDKYGSSVKDYTSLVEIIDPPRTIQVGMTAEVQFFIQHLPNALQIPIESVYEHKKHLFCLRKLGADAWETVQVEIGATNDSMAVVKSGLHEGDQVALAPRDHLDLLALPEINDLPDRKIFREIGASRHEEPAAKSRPARRRGVDLASDDKGTKRATSKREKGKKSPESQR